MSRRRTHPSSSSKPRTRKKASGGRKSAVSGRSRGEDDSEDVSAGTPRRLRLTVAVLAILAGGGVLALNWFNTTAGRLWLAERGNATGRVWLQERLERSLLAGFAETGVAPDSVRIVAGEDGRPTTLRADTEGDLLELNVALTRQVEAAGGRVHVGQRREDRDAAVLELIVGTRGHLTHRILAHTGEAAEELEPPPPPLGRLAIVVDDWGYKVDGAARRILDLEVPITLAVLPDRPRSRRILTEAARAGKATLLHYPMEPLAETGKDPGAGALRVGMAPLEIEDLTERLLDGMPGVQGVNNHMGSWATQHRQEMEAVMEVLARRGLFFLDSRTTPHSKAFDAAEALGIPALRNDLFLDLDTEDVSVVQARLDRLVKKARERGWAIGIGHVNDTTAEALERVLPGLLEGDVQPVFLADLVGIATP